MSPNPSAAPGGACLDAARAAGRAAARAGWRALAPGLLAMLGLCAAGRGQATPASDLQRDLAGLATWSADFRQTIEGADGKVLRSAAGRLYLQKPGRFRWDYREPSEQLILGDGKRIWFYDKDLGQANVRDMDASLASTPASLLSGGGTVDSQFEVTALPPSEGLQWFQLVPKHADTDFQAVRIGFEHGELRRMLLADKLDQVTRLTFSHSQRNEKLPAELFSFTPPPGVDVIGLGAK